MRTPANGKEGLQLVCRALLVVGGPVWLIGLLAFDLPGDFPLLLAIAVSQVQITLLVWWIALGGGSPWLRLANGGAVIFVTWLVTCYVYATRLFGLHSPTLNFTWNVLLLEHLLLLPGVWVARRWWRLQFDITAAGEPSGSARGGSLVLHLLIYTATVAAILGLLRGVARGNWALLTALPWRTGYTLMQMGAAGMVVASQYVLFYVCLMAVFSPGWRRGACLFILAVAAGVSLAAPVEEALQLFRSLPLFVLISFAVLLTFRGASGELLTVEEATRRGSPTPETRASSGLAALVSTAVLLAFWLSPAARQHDLAVKHIRKRDPFRLGQASLDSLVVNGAEAVPQLERLLAWPRIRSRLISFRWNRPRPDMLSSILPGLQALQDLHVEDAELSPADIRAIVEHPVLSNVQLWQCNVTDADLLQFRRLATLRTLDVSTTPVTFAGVANYVRSVPGLRPRWLRFPSGDLTPYGEQSLCPGELKLCKNVSTADLQNALPFRETLRAIRIDAADPQALDDRAIPHLLQFQGLRYLDITGTAISAGGILALQQALPECSIRYPREAMTNDALSQARSWGVLKRADLSGTFVTDQGLATLIAAQPQLERLSLAEAHRVTDACLESIVGLKNLRRLNLRGARIRHLDAIEALPQLEVLGVSVSMLAATDLQWLPKLNRLEVLDLFNNDANQINHVFRQIRKLRPRLRIIVSLDSRMESDYESTSQ